MTRNSIFAWPGKTPAGVTTLPGALGPAKESGGKRRNFGLDLIRASAISLVLLGHYALAFPVGGVLGVELFFVLSGYLIGGILYRLIQSRDEFILSHILSFWLRRWLRTLPSYYLFLGVFSITAVLQKVHLHWHDFWPYLLFMQNFAWSPPSFYGISWSLAVEEWFYLLLPLVFFLIYALPVFRRRGKRSIFLAVALFFVGLSLVLRTMASSSAWESNMRMIVVYRFDALMFGVLLAVVETDRAEGWRLLRRLFPFGLALMAVCTFIAARGFRGGLLIPAAALMTLLPLGCAMALPATVGWTPSSKLLLVATTYVSRCSYSIYLCHLPLLWFCMAAGHDAAQGWLGKLLIRLFALGATLVCAGLLYQFFERPILDLAPKDPYSPLFTRRMHREKAA
jgi:peptidoglycan/LPS O-acetylase OafA/YrhL